MEPRRASRRALVQKEILTTAEEQDVWMRAAMG
jgi:hypothetical protein